MKRRHDLVTQKQGFHESRKKKNVDSRGRIKFELRITDKKAHITFYVKINWQITFHAKGIGDPVSLSFGVTIPTIMVHLHYYCENEVFMSHEDGNNYMHFETVKHYGLSICISLVSNE